MHIANRFLKRSAVAGTVATLASVPARADWSLVNMPEGVSVLSREIYSMHMIMLWICTIIAVVTFGAMIYAMVRFRKSKGAVADHKMLHNARLEAAWTIVPVLILVGVLSSVASDAGYLILIPLGAAAFMSVGRHPLAGLAHRRVHLPQDVRLALALEGRLDPDGLRVDTLQAAGTHRRGHRESCHALQWRWPRGRARNTTDGCR